MYCRKKKKPFPLLTQVRAPYFMISYIKKIYYRNFDRKKLRNLFSFITAYAKKIWNLWRSFTLREKCPYSKFSWHVFSRIWNEYGEILPISPYSVQMRVITDQRKLWIRTPFTQCYWEQNQPYWISNFNNAVQEMLQM